MNPSPALIRSPVLLAGGLLLGAILVASVDAAPYETFPRRSGAEEVTFEVRFDAPDWSTGGPEGADLYPTWPGLRTTDTPGDPAVPAAWIRVALPPAPPGTDPAAGLRVETRIAEAGRRSGVILPPVPGWAPGEKDGSPTPVYRRGSGFDGPTQPFATIHYVGIERGVRVATVAVHPLTWDPQSRTAVWAERVTVTVAVTGAAAPGRPTRPDPVGALARSLDLVNPEAAENFRSPQQVPAGGTPDSWFDDAAGWVKIHIRENGIYRITGADLAAAGVPIGSIDPRNLRMVAGLLTPEVEWGGRPTWLPTSEVPGFGGFGTGGIDTVAIQAPDKSTLAAGDAILFYALGPDNFRDRYGLALDTAEDWIENPYTDHTVYWLGWGSTPTAPARMGSWNGTPSGGALTTSATERVHAERNSVYAPSLWEPGIRWETFFWDFIDNQGSGKRFIVPLPQATTGSQIDAHLRFWGSNIPTQFGSGDDFLHHIQVDINGSPLGVFKWGGPSYTEALTRQDVTAAGLPTAASTEVILRVPDVGTNPSRYDQIDLAWIELTYQRDLRITEDQEELPVDSGPAGRTLRIEAPAGSFSTIFDVTDFRNPRLFLGATRTEGPGGVTYDLAWPTDGSGRLATVEPSGFRTPAALVLDTPPPASPGGATWLRDDSEPVDYIIITHDAFLSEAERLAARRRTALYPFNRPGRVRVVRVSDVMDEFAAGMWDPMAIRYFLEYAYRYYGAAQSADPLAYCLFLGDHTYDFRDRIGVGEPDLVPSWEDNRSDIEQIVTGNVTYASDDPLARFDGPFDLTPDLNLGRISASTLAEARAAIDKILRLEESPVYGPWRGRAVLVSDDICQRTVPDPVGLGFIITTELVDRTLPPVYDRTKIFLADYGTECIYNVKPVATAALIQAWRRGAWLVNYLGHGNEFFLADERLLEPDDLPNLGDPDHLPIFMAAASRTGKFNLPGQDGITESMVTLPGAGAVVAIGSGSNQTGAQATFQLDRNFVDNLFTGSPNDPVPAGAAFMQAKRVTPENAIFTYFGDPAFTPTVPRLDLTLSGPDSLVRGMSGTILGTVENPVGRSGVADLQIEDNHRFVAVGNGGYTVPGPVLFHGTAPVQSDETSAGFIIPIDAAGGDSARVRVYASGTDWEALGAIDPRVLAGTVDPALDTEGPVIVFSPYPTPVPAGDEITASLQDPSGIRIAYDPQWPPALTVSIDDNSIPGTVVPLDALFAYDLGSVSRGTVKIPVPPTTDPGTYIFTLRARDNFNNSSSLAVEVEVGASSNRAAIREVYAFPNPFPEETRVVFTLDRSVPVKARIYSVSGRLVREFEIAGTTGRNGFTWDGRDRAGDTIANGVYLLRLSTGNDDHLERLVLVR